ncbi:MAG: hypothetical protein LBG80_11655 [Bacteroidales bacterium]|jgi:hypothetical protein|nr:hypothetical protein [Bacteroidales bacterium]
MDFTKIIKNVTPKELNKVSSFVNNITPKEIKKMEALTKQAVVPYQDAIKDALPNFPNMTVYNAALSAVSKAFNETSLKTNIQDMVKLISRVQKTIKTVAQLPEVIQATNSFLSIYQNVYRVIDNYSIICNGLKTYTFDALYRNYDLLSKLNNFLTAYDNKIHEHEIYFDKIDFLNHNEKRFLLDTEIKQKENIKLRPYDFQYADIYTFNAKNHVSFISYLTGYTSVDDESSVIYDDEALDLQRRISKHRLSLKNSLEGAKQSALSNIPDKVRHTCVSLRESLKQVINILSPDEKQVREYCIAKGYSYKGKSPIHYHIEYIFKDIPDTNIIPFLNVDVNSVKKIINFLSKNTHSPDYNLSNNALIYLVNKVESIICLLLEYSQNISQEFHI